MARSHSHSKKNHDEESGDPAGSPSVDRDVSADDLRRHVAMLAEQVRQLGETAESDADASREPISEPDPADTVPDWVKPGTADPEGADAAEGVAGCSYSQPLPGVLPPPPRPRPRYDSSQAPLSAPVPSQPASPTQSAGVEPTSFAGSTGENAQPKPDGEPAARESFTDHTSRLVASVVTLAELAAVEIRASAEVEAAAIRAQTSERISAATTNHLVTLLERQRQMLAALATQTDRLERASAVLRAQIRALEAEREHIAEVLASSRGAL